jgi:hypothetical protein
VTKPGFHLRMLKPNNSQSSGCKHIRQTRRKCLNKRCLPARNLMATVFCDRKRGLMVEFMLQGTTITYCETLTKLRTADNSERGRRMLISGEMCVHIQLLKLEHCWSISAGSCLTILLTALISLRETTTCLPT